MTTEWTNPHKPKYDHGHLHVLEKELRAKYRKMGMKPEQIDEHVRTDIGVPEYWLNKKARWFRGSEKTDKHYDHVKDPVLKMVLLCAHRQTGVPNPIKPHHKYHSSDIDMDDIDLVEHVMEMEEEHGVDLFDHELDKIKTPQHMANLINKKLKMNKQSEDLYKQGFIRRAKEYGISEALAKQAFLKLDGMIKQTPVIEHNKGRDAKLKPIFKI